MARQTIGYKVAFCIGCKTVDQIVSLLQAVTKVALTAEALESIVRQWSGDPRAGAQKMREVFAGSARLHEVSVFDDTGTCGLRFEGQRLGCTWRVVASMTSDHDNLQPIGVTVEVVGIPLMSVVQAIHLVDDMLSESAMLAELEILSDQGEIIPVPSTQSASNDLITLGLWVEYLGALKRWQEARMPAE